MKPIDKMTIPELQEHIHSQLVWAIGQDIFKSQVEHWIVYLLGRGGNPRVLSFSPQKQMRRNR